MPSRTAVFPIAAGVPTGNQTATVFLILTVRDSGNNVVLGPLTFGGTATAASVSLPIGTGYTATLVARDSAGATDASPPSVTFDVPPPPPPPAPPDPTIGLPTIS